MERTLRRYARAYAESTSVEGMGGAPGLTINFETITMAHYLVGFRLLKMLPFTVLTFPVKTLAFGGFDCGGLCEPTASIQIEQGSVEHVNLVARAQGDFPLEMPPVSFRMALNETALVNLSASCRTIATAPTTPSSSCTVTADPIWELDQEAFDAEWGAASFPLDQYVAFEFDDVPVPEPAAPAMAAVGALVLAGAALGPGRRRTPRR